MVCKKHKSTRKVTRSKVRKSAVRSKRRTTRRARESNVFVDGSSMANL